MHCTCSLFCILLVYNGDIHKHRAKDPAAKARSGVPGCIGAPIQILYRHSSMHKHRAKDPAAKARSGVPGYTVGAPRSTRYKSLCTSTSTRTHSTCKLTNFCTC